MLENVLVMWYFCVVRYLNSGSFGVALEVGTVGRRIEENRKEIFRTGAKFIFGTIVAELFELWLLFGEYCGYSQHYQPMPTRSLYKSFCAEPNNAGLNHNVRTDAH